MLTALIVKGYWIVAFSKDAAALYSIDGYKAKDLTLEQASLWLQ